MISDACRYYGSALSSIVELSSGPVSIQKLSKQYAGFYLINEFLPIYIKYSTSRRGPWTFNFQRAHQELQESYCCSYGECMVVFVCGKDGVAALTHLDFRKVLDDFFEEQESVTIKRKHNEMYRVRGSNGTLERKVSRNSLNEYFISKKIEHNTV